MLTLTTQILRDPTGVVSLHDTPTGLTTLAPSLLGITALGAGLFGAVVGSYHGGIQILFAGLKMPLLLLVPLVVTLPSLWAALGATGVQVSWRRLALAGLCGMARTAVLAAAAGPVLWLLYSVSISYISAVLVMTMALGLVGLPGLLTVVAVLPSGGQLRWMVGGGTVLLLSAVFAQSGWLLRPFVLAPESEAAFLRPLEEDVVQALDDSVDELSPTGNRRMRGLK